MSDDAIHINVVGGSQAEGELKKVAGGYRAIGHAAEQAAHSADKVHGGGSHERKRAQTFSKAFLGGRSGAGGAVGHMAHLGVAGGAAYLAMEGAVQLAEVLKRGTEEALDNIKFQREITRDISAIETKRGDMALAAARGMTTFDKGREEHEHTALGSVLAQVEAFERMKQAEEKATRAGDASGALSAEKSAYASPALTAVMAKLKPKKDELDDIGYEAQHESKIGRFMANLEAITHLEFSKIGHASAEDRYADASTKYQEQSSEAVDKAMESDKARRETVEAAMKLNEAAGALHGAVTRTQSSIPSN